MNEVIKLEYPEPSIALITMQDKKSRNTFSDEFMNGLKQSFAAIKKNPELKAVVLTGYDNFFACGGTHKDLIELNEGKKTFAALDFYNLPFECELPTIAAAQGHAFGGGLSFACMCDFMVFALESYYSANFMKYGFTPGMGATHNLPIRFGSELGKEMLFTAKDYSGHELHARNPELHILPRNKVLEKALNLAREIASKPVESVKLLKKKYYDELKDTLYAAVEKELKMHEKTITSEETTKRIKILFEDIREEKK